MENINNTRTGLLGSYLYNLSPLGIETEYIESLSSYIMRLSETHNVKPGALLKHILIPLLQINYPSNNFKSYGYFYRINGVSTFVDNVIEILEELTLCINLKFLTLIPLREAFNTDTVIEETNSWCPYCLKEWAVGSKPLYYPQIWNFSKVIICPIHNTPLQKVCPKCKKELKVLTYSSRVGYCYFCHTWLGEIELYGYLLKNPHIDLEYQKWLIRSIQEFFINIECLSYKDIKVILSKNLETLIIKAGGVVALSKRVGISYATILGWIRYNGDLPNLNKLLDFCYALNISLYNMIFNVNIQPTFGNFISTNKRRIKNIDLKQCEVFLKEILNQYPVPQMHEIEKEIGRGETFLRRHFPELIKSISIKRTDYRKEKKENRRNVILKEVKDAILELHAEGLYPASNRVISRVGNQHLFFIDGVRDTWLEMLSQLGYKDVY